MKPEEFVRRQAEAIEAFDRRENRCDGIRVASSLAGGLTVLRDSLYARLRHDVERLVGRDSMLLPVSEKKSEIATKTEIELYQIAESAAAVGQFKYVGGSDDWYLRWLAGCRLSELQRDAGAFERLADYSSQPPDDRRLAFTDVLARVLPESRRAPLVVFRLLPMAVQIATALAFGDHPQALEIRSHQIRCLPAIEDCHRCRGGMLENGEQCHECGNPMWKSEWLTAT